MNTRLVAALAVLVAAAGLAFPQETHDFSQDRVTRTVAQKTFLPGNCTAGDLVEYIAPPAVPAIYICGNSHDWNLIGATGAPPSGTGFAHVTLGAWDVPAALLNGDIPATLTGKTVDGVSPTTFGFLDATSSIQTQLNAKAALASPAFTGNPTAPTQTTGDNSTKLATTAFVIANAGSGGGSLVMTTGAGTPSANCAAPSTSNLAIYNDSTNNDIWFCYATNLWKKVLSVLSSGQYLVTGTVGAAPSNPSSGSVTCYFSSVSLTQICLDTSGNAFSMVKGVAGTTGSFVTNIDSSGVQHLAAPVLHLGGYEVGAENASAAFATGDLTNHAFVISESAKTLTEASCVSDAGNQTVTVKIGSTTLFSIHCVAPGTYSAATTDGSTGYIIAASMGSTAVGAHSQLDLSGTANTTTKDIKLHVYGQ